MGVSKLIVALGAVLVAGASGGGGVDPQIGSGPPQPGLRDAQNEPAIAVDAGAVARGVPGRKQPLAVGANDYYDEAACGSNVACSFYPGVGISGVYFSGDGGSSWTPQGALQYHGYTIPRAPRPGRIVTVPRFAKRYASHGDPALAFGPRPGGAGFAWARGSRLYYAMLAQRFSNPKAGPQFIAVSRTDDVGSAAGSSGANAWMPPKLVSNRTRGDSFADKPAIWADNAASSPHFGSVYVCWASYKNEAEAGRGEGSPRPILFSRSTDGGKTWSAPHALAKGATGGATRQGCAVRTDSEGWVYVVWEGSSGRSGPNSIYMTHSRDGGATFDRALRVARVYDVGQPDPGQGGRKTFDGRAGARTNSWPSIDIANGAPYGKKRDKAPPNTIVLAWADARAGLDREQALVRYSTNRGMSWSQPQNAAASKPPAGYPVERPDFPAVAISPNGRSLYVVYTAFYDPWQSSPLSPRRMGGVMRATKFADFVAHGQSAVWTEVPPQRAVGDARGTSSVNGEERGARTGLAAEFIGDYNSVVATDRAGYAAWVDVASTTNCRAVNTYRITPRLLTAPNIAKVCPSEFGNANLFGAVIPAKR